MAAEYAAPTTRYPHGALGDPVEHGQMRVRLSDGRALTATLPEDLVFEDTAPRLSDLDGDGSAEIIVVESHADQGARLAVWHLNDTGLTRAAATPFIGRRFRWLAPTGAADLDEDGRVEIAYVETPHLGRVLKVLRWQDGQLVPVAKIGGVSNHRFGQSVIEGRIARCDGQPTILLADAGWRRVVGARLHGNALSLSDLGPYRGPQSFQAVAGCD
ncbi:FG-GAP repeat domain-containing protein [Albidovulum inexpectatum]|uniref:FG-GAP repeat domain-containing protein n=1 Tax=Albidovulum inexpectatum TaxID=196587 RepID=UPI00147382BC|nr:VCBS repeat-containing protein [Albidovulum inexpectatum]